MTRKVDVGSVLTRTFQTYGSQFTLLIPAALVVFVPIAILSGLALAASPLLGFLVGTLLAVLGGVLYQGMVVEAARDMLDGRRDQTIGSLVGGAAPVVVPLLIAGVLVGIATALGLILLIVGAFLVATIFAVTAPAIVIERVGAIDGMKRSIDLVKPHFLPALGVLAVVLLINIVASFVLQLIFSSIDDGVVGYSLATLITQALLAPITALAASILYFDLAGLAPQALTGQGQVAPQPGARAPSAGPPPTS